MTLVLSKPISVASVGGVPGTNITGVVIPPATTTTVDSVSTISQIGIKWIYTIGDPVGNLIQSGEVLAHHHFGASPVHNVTGIIGDMIPRLIDVAIAAGNLQLNITNNHINQLKVNVVRIELLTM